MIFEIILYLLFVLDKRVFSVSPTFVFYNRMGPGFESSAGDLSGEVVNCLNYSATNLSDLSD